MLNKMSGIGGGTGARYGRGAGHDNYHDNNYRRQASRNDNDSSTEPTQYSHEMQINY